MSVSIGSEAQFKTLISTKRVVVVDWYADWCGPCKAIAPEFESLARANPQVTFLKVNVDSFPVIMSAHADRISQRNTASRPCPRLRLFAIDKSLRRSWAPISKNSNRSLPHRALLQLPREDAFWDLENLFRHKNQERIQAGSFMAP